MGPPLDGLFAEESGRQTKDLQPWLTACCPKLLLLAAWDLSSSVPVSGDGWMWKRLENNALQGSQLTQ